MCDTHFEYQVDHKDVFAKRGNAIVYTEYMVAPVNISELMTGSTPPEMREIFHGFIYDEDIKM